MSKVFCLNRHGRNSTCAKQTYDARAAKQSIVKGLRRVKRIVREGEMTQIRAAHLEGCLRAMEDIMEGGWDDRSPPEGVEIV
jgi:hypothetical protein